MSASTTPTPYDTGERLEPKSWLPYGTEVTGITPAENFGKVDFDDDEGATVAVAYMARDEDGGYTLHVVSLDAVGAVRVNLVDDQVATAETS